MKVKSWIQKLFHFIIGSFILVAVCVIIYQQVEKRKPVAIKANLLEEIVYVRTDDDIVDAGVMLSPKKENMKPVAVILLHGWGVNFYSPSYINIGRAMAARGYTCIIGNTRMHDIGNVERYEWGKRIRGGGYWGTASDEVRDIAAWVDLAESKGFKKVILVGHSAGWSAVRMYQAEEQDERVIGMVSASGGIMPAVPDTTLFREASSILADGDGEELIKIPGRSFPSYISAATYIDYTRFAPEQNDFFGFKISTPAITKVTCPILIFFGTDGDVGNEAELESLKLCLKKQPNLKSKIVTTMIKNADHMYKGEEEQVAETITAWAASILSEVN
jgi:pimeloyl-ACP methyl ester carboxylesterase